MRRSLSVELRLTLIKCFVISKLDYCNFLYICCNLKQKKPLQKCLNAAVRFVYDLRKSQGTSEFLKRAHILPIQSRISYKICLIAYKIVNKMAPDYLTNMVSNYVPNRDLRSANDRTKLVTGHMDKTIASKMCTEWNNIPQYIREIKTIGSFKTQPKTYFFNKAFN